MLERYDKIDQAGLELIAGVLSTRCNGRNAAKINKSLFGASDRSLLENLALINGWVDMIGFVKELKRIENGTYTPAKYNRTGLCLIGTYKRSPEKGDKPPRNFVFLNLRPSAGDRFVVHSSELLILIALVLGLRVLNYEYKDEQEGVIANITKEVIYADTTPIFEKTFKRGIFTCLDRKLRRVGSYFNLIDGLQTPRMGGAAENHHALCTIRGFDPSLLSWMCIKVGHEDAVRLKGFRDKYPLSSSSYNYENRWFTDGAWLATYVWIDRIITSNDIDVSEVEQFNLLVEELDAPQREIKADVCYSLNDESVTGKRLTFYI